MEEIKSNRALMAEWHPYHDSTKVNFKRLKNNDAFIKSFVNDKEILFDTLFTREIFMQHFPSKSAYEIAKSNTLISNIDYSYMKLLADTYSAQESVFQPVLDMFKFYHVQGINKEKVVRGNLDIMFYYINETVSREVYYMQNCDSALAKIKVDR